MPRAILDAGPLATDHARERGHPLLAIEEQLDIARRKRAIAAMGGRTRLRRRDERSSDRMPPAERLECEVGRHGFNDAAA